METQIKQSRIYEKVVDEIKNAISKGALRPGDPLPAERTLMDRMGVSRSSLREAFRVLELLGLLESIPGKGRFVRKPRGYEDEEGAMPLEDAAILELMEARRILDPAIAVEAARRALPSDLMHMRRIMSSTEIHIESLAQRARHDFDFHLALAEATHLFVFVNIARMNFNLIMATHERIYGLLDDKEAFVKEHMGLYEAILNHDMRLAASEATAHIDRIYRTLQEGFALEEMKRPLKASSSDFTL